jgi:ATP/maltotriose-dependent transcriptional regulator MalT
LWVQGDLDSSAAMLKEALRTFREIGDRAGIASVDTGLSKVLILKNDLPGARAALLDALKIDQETGVKGDTAFIRILLAQVDLAEGHAEQVDETAMQSSIDEIRSEQHGGDEVEALAIQIRLFLAKKKLGPARQSLERAQAVHNTSWLSKYDLMLAEAKVDAARGKIPASRRKLEAARSQARKAGCRACSLESVHPTSSLGNITRSASSVWYSSHVWWSC